MFALEKMLDQITIGKVKMNVNIPKFDITVMGSEGNTCVIRRLGREASICSFWRHIDQRLLWIKEKGL